jgi:monooxygenase
VTANEHFDVVIVGAGLSGIGAGRWLADRLPHKSFVILEAREAIGGTWDLFRYPGIRSDSDMFTLSYGFKPWLGHQAITEGKLILDYLHQTAREKGLDRHIRLSHRVVAASFDSEQARWTLTVRRTDTGETARLSCSFLLCCTGYYRYEHGHMPQFAGVEDYRGRLIHPQHWPEDLDYAGRQIVVIGSGATAVTLVPALARRAAHVTMLQRTPSYIVSLPSVDPLALRLRRWPGLATRLIRAKNIALMTASYQLSRRWPSLVKRALARQTRRLLPPNVALEEHFRPPYEPWDQRLCVTPDGDLFRALVNGEVSIVTDRIERFTPSGLRLVSGRELTADIVVSATGLELLVLGGMRLEVEGRLVDVAETMGYRGLMLSGVPNMALVIGYTNASWTLKCDLTCQFVCRLLAHMDANGYDRVTAICQDPTVEPRPFLDLRSGYVQRAADRLPRQGSKRPWRLRQNYLLDLIELRRANFDDGALRFERAAVPSYARDQKAALWSRGDEGNVADRAAARCVRKSVA